MPQKGFGTYLIPDDKIIETIGKAYEIGYRKFDTAWKYKNEAQIAEALKVYGIKREDVFITTKLHANALYLHRYHGGKLKYFNIPIRTIKKAIELSFKNLGGGYIDLFLVHYPWLPYLDMWKELTKYYKEGRIRAIGVSSFLPPVIESLKEVSDVVPALNQFEISPLNTQKKLIKYCQDHGIVVEAMSTFSHYHSNEVRKEITENETIKPIAEKHNKSIPQVVLKWLLQQDIAIIPKTWDENHLRENFDLDDFELSDDEMAIIDSLDRGKFLNYEPFFGLKSMPKKYRDWKGYE